MFERSPFSYRADPLVPAFPDDKPIFFFDGVCGLCTGFAEFILRHDRRGVFRIATVQSPLGQALLAHYGLPTDDFTTNLLLADGRPRLKSDALHRYDDASSRALAFVCADANLPTRLS
jgi:predicted DCC family thiol-disulfide oxidoreductase YuxK